MDSLKRQNILIMCQLYHCCLLSYHIIFLSLSSHVGKWLKCALLSEAQVLLLINCFEILGRKVLYDFEVQIPQKV